MDNMTSENSNILFKSFLSGKKTMGIINNGNIGINNLFPQQYPPCQLDQKHIVRYQIKTIKNIIKQLNFAFWGIKNIPKNEIRQIGLKFNIPLSDDIKYPNQSLLKNS
jgi:hypothetical protein